ncbi:hypothetical protein EXIGLDRAFT_693195 [Exidia glandulosa HHB12029]|uniref:Uncharacterized protein n=1 Tax=Exidia glandulosa HHB12029 TaxID=1314781 RepID=A0A165HH14_EXIGL|nr:hypothetical protein EXIGLDRAFT_693195 [Exidia glandulosa HHB12029]
MAGLLTMAGLAGLSQSSTFTGLAGLSQSSTFTPRDYRLLTSVTLDVTLDKSCILCASCSHDTNKAVGLEYRIAGSHGPAATDHTSRPPASTPPTSSKSRPSAGRRMGVECSMAICNANRRLDRGYMGRKGYGVDVEVFVPSRLLCLQQPESSSPLLEAFIRKALAPAFGKVHAWS